jgi:phosphatidylserine/phosphatidylglycerophosphate/cardiolipin synthase-like enzyme
MQRLFSNGPNKDYVRGAFERLARQSRNLFLAAPYFNYEAPVIEASKQGKAVDLLIGLNKSTSPQSLGAVFSLQRVKVRYFTRHFHAKLYIFDYAALVGSANLTDAGMNTNREGVICFDGEDDREAIEEARTLFNELWRDANVLTADRLKMFAQIVKSISSGPDPDKAIEQAVGAATPMTIRVESRQATRDRLFMGGLRQQVYQEYLPAFSEVQSLLTSLGLHRPEMTAFGPAHATNRFLAAPRKRFGSSGLT